MLVVGDVHSIVLPLQQGLMGFSMRLRPISARQLSLAYRFDRGLNQFAHRAPRLRVVRRRLMLAGQFVHAPVDVDADRRIVGHWRSLVAA